jgi:hypothetical protein
MYHMVHIKKIKTIYFSITLIKTTYSFSVCSWHINCIKESQTMRLQMKRIIYNIFFTIIITSLLISNLYAQRDQTAIREFNELKVYLTKIWVVVQRFDNERARDLMAQAKHELDKAEDLIFNQQKYIIARVHMLKARSLGNQAAKIVLAQPINRLKKQLDDIINMSERNSENMHSDEARYLLNQAKKFRSLAYKALEAGRTNRAQEYYRIAFYFADKSLNLTNRTDSDLDSQIAELKSNIDLLFNQTEEVIKQSNNNRFNNLLNEAKKHYADAMHLLDTGRINLAQKKLRLIEKLLYRIVDQVDRSTLNKKDRIKNDLYSIKAFLEALEKEAVEYENQRVNVFLNRARAQYSDATRAYESGRLEVVKNKLNLSQRFASKALQLMKSGTNYESTDMESQINDNKRLLDLQKPQVEKSENKLLIKMFREAERLTNNAIELNEQNNQRSALQNLQLSTRLMNRIQRQIDYSATEDNVQINDIQNRLNRAKSMLNKLKNNQELQIKFHNEIQQLDNLYNEAENHFEKQDYQIANEYLNYILQQINKRSNEWSQHTK